MDQGASSTNGPHQGAWVETQTGESWFIHFQDRGAYGRITHLQPLTWINNWPVPGTDKDNDGKGEPVATYKKPNVGKKYSIITPVESDEFNSNTPGLQWQWHANSKVSWSAEILGSGFLRLYALRRPQASKNFWDVPNLLLQKFPAPDFNATVKLQLVSEYEEKQAGLLVMGGDYSFIAIKKEKDGYYISQVICKDAEKGGLEKTYDRHMLKNQWIYIRVTILSPNAECRFSYSEDGITFTPIGETFVSKPDKWIGAKVGIFCNSLFEARNGGYADFDWFRIDKN
jgi:beta-xylosidase